MKKLDFMFFVPLLVFMALPAANTDGGTKANTANQELRGIFPHTFTNRKEGKQ